MPMRQTVIQAVFSTFHAMRNCEKSGNEEWRARHERRLHSIARNVLPNGSGFDAGTSIMFDECLTSEGMERMIFHTSFHHMNGAGYYVGWTDHDVIVEPCFSGISVYVRGRDRNQIKDYIAEEFCSLLSQQVSELPEYQQKAFDEE
jgi:hypothetical protein